MKSIAGICLLLAALLAATNGETKPHPTPVPVPVEVTPAVVTPEAKPVPVVPVVETRPVKRLLDLFTPPAIQRTCTAYGCTIAPERRDWRTVLWNSQWFYYCDDDRWLVHDGKEWIEFNATKAVPVSTQTYQPAVEFSGGGCSDGSCGGGGRGWFGRRR